MRKGKLNEAIRAMKKAQKDELIGSTVNDITDIVYHCVAHGLIADPEFNVWGFLHEFRLVMEDALIPEYLIKDIIDEAETKGLLAVVSPASQTLVDALDGAAQISPAYNPRLLILVELLQNLLSEVN